MTVFGVWIDILRFRFSEILFFIIGPHFFVKVTEIWQLFMIRPFQMSFTSEYAKIVTVMELRLWRFLQNFTIQQTVYLLSVWLSKALSSWNLSLTFEVQDSFKSFTHLAQSNCFSWGLSLYSNRLSSHKQNNSQTYRKDKLIKRLFYGLQEIHTWSGSIGLLLWSLSCILWGVWRREKDLFLR